MSPVDDPAEPILPGPHPGARLDPAEAAEALGTEVQVVEAALEEAGLDPEDVGRDLLGADPEAPVEALSAALDRSEASVAVALADAVEIRDDELVDLTRRLEIDPGEIAAEVRTLHLQDLVGGSELPRWVPFRDRDRPPTLREVVRVARQTQRRVVAGGAFAAILLVALGVAMLQAPPALREALAYGFSILLVVLGAALVWVLVRASAATDQYLAQVEAVSDEFEEDSVALVTELAQQAGLEHRVREEALRRAWTLFRDRSDADDGEAPRDAEEDVAPGADEAAPEADPAGPGGD